MTERSLGSNPTEVAAEKATDALTVVLAEYQLVSALRVAQSGNASSGIGHLFVAASLAVAALAGLTSVGWSSAGVRFAVVAGFSLTVLCLGLLVFHRIVHFSVHRCEYDEALNALRTYLVRHSPDVAPYFLLPTLVDRSALPPRPPAGVGLLAGFNGVVIGVGSAATALAAGLSYLLGGWFGAVTALASVGLHFWYARRVTWRGRESMDQVLASRGWSKS